MLLRGTLALYVEALVSLQRSTKAPESDTDTVAHVSYIPSGQMLPLPYHSSKFKTHALVPSSDPYVTVGQWGTQASDTPKSVKY